MCQFSLIHQQVYEYFIKQNDNLQALSINKSFPHIFTKLKQERNQSFENEA